MFQTLRSIEEHIRLVGYLTGEEARAETEAVRFRSIVERAAARKPAGTTPPRVLGLGGHLQLRFRDAFHRHHAGARRRERCRNARPRRIRPGHRRAHRSVESRLDRRRRRSRPGERRSRTPVSEPRQSQPQRPRGAVRFVVLENHVFLPLSPFTAALVDALSLALYGGARL